MKKIITLFICTLMLFLLGSCSGGVGRSDGKISVVATIFPEYDWLRALTDGCENPNIELSLLIDNGTDLHSYQPTADDLIAISTCDMLVYVGGESDAWIDDALKNAANSDMVVVKLLDVLGEDVHSEETVEGMESEKFEVKSDEESDAELEYDEHVWLSLRNAKKICAYLTDRLIEIDPANAEYYRIDSESYASGLTALDNILTDMTSSAKRTTLLFADRFPFRYLVEDYGLDYYAAFPGCSAETEASFATVTFLASKIDEFSLPCVLTLDGSDSKIAETVISATKSKNQTILTLNSMQSVTAADIEAGVTYLSVMRENLDVIHKALN